MSHQPLYDLLILDYGGVYSFEYHLESFDVIMKKTFGRKPTDKERRKISVYSHLLTAGEMTSQQYVDQVASTLHSDKPEVTAFEENTIAVTFDPSLEMVNLLQNAKNAGIKVALLSNMYLFEVLRTKSSERYTGFDHVAFSAESKMTKSDTSFFSHTLAYFNIDAIRTLFVDDVAEYTQTAQKLGIETIHADKEQFKNAQELATAIQKKLNI